MLTLTLRRFIVTAALVAGTRTSTRLDVPPRGDVLAALLELGELLRAQGHDEPALRRAVAALAARSWRWSSARPARMA